MKLPTLSVCIVVRNNTARLERILKSCRSIANEIILIDSCSSKQLNALAEQYGVKIYDCWPKDGYDRTYQLGLEKATGAWQLWLDASERLPPSTLTGIPSLLLEDTAGYYFQLYRQPSRSPDPGLILKNLGLRLFRKNEFFQLENGPVIDGDSTTPDLSLKLAYSGLGIWQDDHEPFFTNQSQKSGHLLLLPCFDRFKERPLFQQYQTGMISFENGDFESAVKCFIEARAILPKEKIFASAITYNLIITYLRQQQEESARQELTRGLEQFPDFIDLYYLEGLFHFQQFEFDQAQSRWEEYLRFEEIFIKKKESTPAYPVYEGGLCYLTLYRLGQIAYVLGRAEQANKYWLQAFELLPEWIVPIERWVKLQMELGRKPEETAGFIRNYLHEDNFQNATLQYDLLRKINVPAVFLSILEADQKKMLTGSESQLRYIFFKTECLLKLQYFRTVDSFLSLETKSLFSRFDGWAGDLQQLLAKLWICHCLGRWHQSPPKTACDIINKLPLPDTVLRNLKTFDNYLCTRKTQSFREKLSSLTPEAEDFLLQAVEIAAITGLNAWIIKMYAFLEEVAGVTYTELLLGKALSKAGDYNGAAFYLEKACEAEECDHEGLAFLGAAYRKKGLFAEARQAYEASLRLQPSRRIYLELSCAYYEEIIHYAGNGLLFMPESEELHTARKEALECLSYLNRLLAMND